MTYLITFIKTNKPKEAYISMTKAGDSSLLSWQWTTTLFHISNAKPQWLKSLGWRVSYSTYPL